VLLLTACANNVTSPSQSSGSVDGRWVGTISPGITVGTISPGIAAEGETSIIFVVVNNRIAEITVGYRLGGCDIVKSFAGLSVRLLPAVPGELLPFPDVPPFPNAKFAFASGLPATPGFTEIGGVFSETGAATGAITFYNIEGCTIYGFPILAYWHATRVDR
jgi:hypothetical protein